MKRIIIQFFVVLAVSFLTTSLAVGARQSGWPEKLVFGVIPTDTSVNMTERYDNLIKYLENKLGTKIEFKVATDYAAVITGMQFKHIDFAYFGPKSYVEAAARANAEAFVLEVTNDSGRGYYGTIIVNKNSPFKTVWDLKGKTFAFTDPNSTSGTLVPTVYFVNEMKIDPHVFFSKVIYSGSHQASILAVKNGKVDAAATNDLDLARGDKKMWDAEKDFTILWRSRLIPGSPIAYRKDLPESLKKALRDAFISYNDKDGLAKLKLKCFEPVTDDTYNTIRELMQLTKKQSQK
ncbi:MAG: phosphonate ABC transporter substrate-binding protein [Syntrophorhabdaceae bacterium]|nr:phosphonate ABC transporter substrate-binding protein [Syntrophorhabdaceae bacterium]